MSNKIQITGNVGKDPELRFTPSGKPVLGFSVADTPRRYNRDSGEWEDAGETLWLNVSLWDRKAETMAEHVVKGVRVMVTGTLKARSYTTREGEQRTVTEVTADEVAIIPKANQQGPQQGQRSAAQEQRAWMDGAVPADRSGGADPWAAPQDDQPPF